MSTYFNSNLIWTLLFIYSCSKNTNLYPDPNTIIKGQQEWQRKFYFERISEFKNEPIGKNKIVFLGNSIMQGGGNWNNRYKSNNIVNRGISGDYTEGILKRLDEITFLQTEISFSYDRNQ